MNTERIDILVVGGLAVSPSVAKGINCKHLPFTSDGLQEAISLIPDCKTVIVIPSKPGKSTTKRSSKERLDENGYFSAKDSDILYQFQTHLYTLANGSSSVYLLIPDDPEVRLLVGGNITIGLRFGTEHKWTGQLEGGRAWMLEGSESSLVLHFADHYGVYAMRSDPLHFTKPLPNPDQLLLGIPRGKVITLGACVVDCAGNIRVLDLRWGKGAFVIASAACLSAILKKHSEPVPLKDDHCGAKPLCVIEEKKIVPGWKRGKLKLNSIPEGKNPARFSFGDKKYTVAGGKAWEIVHKLLINDAFDGHGIDLPERPGDAFKKGHRPFFSDLVKQTDNKKWYLQTNVALRQPVKL